jgi:hypothetical protein
VKRETIIVWLSDLLQLTKTRPQQINLFFYNNGKVVPLHAMEALGGEVV